MRLVCRQGVFTDLLWERKHIMDEAEAIVGVFGGGIGFLAGLYAASNFLGGLAGAFFAWPLTGFIMLTIASILITVLMVCCVIVTWVYLGIKYTFLTLMILRLKT